MVYNVTMSTEIAWAAGFWDGEGSVSLSVRGINGRPRIIAEVAQVDRRVLDRLSKIIGKGKVHGPYQPRTSNSNAYHNWKLEGLADIVELFSMLEPYLSEAKIEQFQRAIVARKEWEVLAQCRLGHPLTKSKSGKMYCLTCRQENGKKNAKPILGHKICTMCKIDKDFLEFNKNNNRLDGRQTACRDCMKQYRTERLVV